MGHCGSFKMKKTQESIKSLYNKEDRLTIIKY